ncbi:MAG: glycosyltransferase [Tildeniella nuda ZEHNDER 1965/U140]|jgi:rhamnosyltransferase|nr:glycosyltransferase [Tildeniella nuda ZEHNDER 1965/U140]
MNPKISVLIRTKNEAKDIVKTLDLVMDQVLIPDEIIVVDSGSTDGTIALVEQYSAVKLITMRPEDFTFGRSLNIGFAATQADIVVALSAHAFPCDRNWLQHLIQPFADPHVAGVYGKQAPHADAYPPVERDYRSFYSDEPREQTNPNEPGDRAFSNANAAIRRQCWEKRPFDETLSGCEDVAWAWAILALGEKIIYAPEAAVYHSHNEPLRQVYKRTYRETLALQVLYGYDMGLRDAWKSWQQSVLADWQFILQQHKDRQWLLRSPLYRLFWTVGYLRPSLPAALWKPFSKQWKRQWARAAAPKEAGS